MLAKKIGITVIIAGAIGVAAGWSASQTKQVEPARVATVDGWGLVQRMLNTDEYLPAREANAQGWAEQLDVLQEDLKGLQDQVAGLSQSDPQRPVLAQQFQAKYQEFQTRGAQARQGFDQFSAGQAAEAFESVKRVATRIAQEQGYTHLLSRKTDAITSTGSIATVTQEIMQRNVFMAPDADDITEAVRLAMDLPEHLPDASEMMLDGQATDPATDEDTAESDDDTSDE